MPVNVRITKQACDSNVLALSATRRYAAATTVRPATLLLFESSMHPQTNKQTNNTNNIIRALV
jgi:hypothetical protein